MASTAVANVPSRMNTSSPLPFGRNRDDACPVCLDLDYDLFQDTVQTQHLIIPENWGKSRHHITDFGCIQASAKAGCNLCAILDQGITFYCDEGILEDISSYDKNEKSDYSAEKTNNVKKEHDNDEAVSEEEEQVASIIFLELRPSRPLSLLAWTRGLPLYLFPFGQIWLDFHTQPGSPPMHPAFRCAPSVPSLLSLEHCAEILQDWLQTCNTHHDSCSLPSLKLPRRLVHIADHGVRLVETESLGYARYTTLSHCWGNAADMIKTTKDNVEQRMSNIEWNQLNQIFKDAIEITKRIGCQWIWIDSLCIIQDDEKDWKEESRKMADVYSNSFLNIATTFSATSSGSSFSYRSIYNDNGRKLPLRSTDIRDELNGSSMGLCVRIAHRLGHHHVTGNTMYLRHQASPLLDRAWVFQERLLAPRTLHVGSSEMMWECNSGLACECGGIRETQAQTQAPARGPKAAFADVCQGRASQEEILSLWRSVVEEYTSLSLTQVSDTPIAIAGIASRISSKLDSEYLAGIWAKDLPRGLLWHTKGGQILGVERRQSPASNQTIPTWSWMSINYAANRNTQAVYSYTEPFERDYRLGVHWYPSMTQWTYSTPFGDVPQGQLEITAATVSGKLNKSYYIRLVCMGDEVGPGEFFRPDSAAADGLEDETEVLCLLFGITSRFSIPGWPVGLVVRPSREGGYYTRIGFIAGTRWNHFDGAEVRSVVVR